MSTIFSRIARGEIPSYKIAEDQDYYAFLDINPIAKGHTLVIPKKEVDYIFDLDDATLSGMILFSKGVAQKLKKSLNCSRVGVVVMGLEVPHAHIHLVPMDSEGDLDFKKPKLKLTTEDFLNIQSEILQM